MFSLNPFLAEWLYTGTHHTHTSYRHHRRLPDPGIYLLPLTHLDGTWSRADQPEVQKIGGLGHGERASERATERARPAFRMAYVWLVSRSCVSALACQHCEACFAGFPAIYMYGQPRTAIKLGGREVAEARTKGVGGSRYTFAIHLMGATARPRVRDVLAAGYGGRTRLKRVLCVRQWGAKSDVVH